MFGGRRSPSPIADGLDRLRQARRCRFQDRHLGCLLGTRSNGQRQHPLAYCYGCGAISASRGCGDPARRRIDRGDRCAIGMPDQQAAAKADRVEKFRQYVERLDVHVIDRTRQRRRRRGAVARRANRQTRRRRWRLQAFQEGRPTGAAEPSPSCSSTRVGASPVRPVMRYSRSDEPMRRMPEGASAIMRPQPLVSPRRRGSIRHARACRRHPRLYPSRDKTWMAGKPGHHELSPSRSLNRWIFPVAVFGKAVDHVDPARIFPGADLLLDVLLQRIVQAVGSGVRAQHHESLRLQQVLPDRPRARPRLPAPPDG